MKRNLTVIFSLVVVAAFMLVAQGSWAYPTYSSNGTSGNCANCHGAFYASGQYVSKATGVGWTDPTTSAAVNLHDGHRNVMLSGDCNTCHTGTPGLNVYTNSSTGGTGFTKLGCTGCHNGDGLRAYHVNTGASTGCYGCHSKGTPPAENVKPPYYFSPDTAHPNKPTDPCNANGSESSVAPPEGLDNDGNLLPDSLDPACKPAGDTTAPVVTFTIPATSASLVVTFTAFTATDNVAVTGYKITTNSTKPLATAGGWTAAAPKNHTFLAAGTKTLWGWAKDAAGNVSAVKSAKVVITQTDAVKPVVSAFTAVASATPLTAKITAFTATDNVKVTGYKITETAAVPLAGATGWKAVKPTTYVAKTSGAKTLYGWAKDAAGNVSLLFTGSAVTIP